MERFLQSLQWVLISGYSALFIAMVFEGPVVTAAGAFAAALGYMDIYIVLVLSVLGNLLPDFVLYFVGFWGRTNLAEKYARRLGLTEERIAALEKLLETHPGKALTIIKLLPIIPTPGLILAGATRMSVKKYVFWSLVITLPTSLFYLVLGYYFGAAYATVVRYLEYGGYFAVIAAAFFGLVFYLHRKISKKLAERIERGKNRNIYK